MNISKYKFVFFSLILCFTHFLALADEGMWLPLLLSKLNQKDMQAKGMKISAEDIYSVNQASLKDAVCVFGGGCTGELISAQGLLLTNHHCGYGYIQSLSRLENNYLQNGFWASGIGKELPAGGLTASFLVRMEDVSQQMLAGVPPNATPAERDAVLARAAAQLSAKAVEGTHYKASVRPFYYGAQFYLFVYEVFTDVRLVGTPPESMGNFGGDTDNWVWPRHTADFSLFRIYAGPDNKPAPYSPANQPYTPRKFLEISLAGIKANDFTMVIGFPGRTQQFLTSFALDVIINKSNPFKIGLRGGRLDIINAARARDPRLKLMYAAKKSDIANGWKKWSGENTGLIKTNAIQKKRVLESKFIEWANKNAINREKYGQILPDLKQEYRQIDSLISSIDGYNEAIMASELLQLAGAWQPLRDSAVIGPISPQLAARFEAQIKPFFGDFDPKTDQKIMAFCLKQYYQQIPKARHPPLFRQMTEQFGYDFDHLAAHIFEKSLIGTAQNNKKLLAALQTKKADLLDKDPAFMLATAFAKAYQKDLLPVYNVARQRIEALSRLYVQGLMQMQPERVFYPDANSTMRIAYGKVEGYAPMNAVEYTWQTHLDGIMEKESLDSAVFLVEPKLKQLCKTKDYGRYATKQNTLPVGFIASNHTSGGNSGSPVLDAYGRLIGTNYDRNWQGTMSDIMYDKNWCRNISLDIRYTLFIIEKLGNSKYLIDEMKIGK